MVVHVDQGGGLPEQHDRRQAAEQLALVLTEHGMQRMTARVMAAFIFTDEATLTQGEVADELGASAGSVSGAIKTLTSVGLLERVPAARSRRDHHRLREDAWATLFSRQNQVVDAMLDAARKGIEITEPDTVARHRVELMHDFYSFMLAELPALLERWRERRRRESP